MNIRNISLPDVYMTESSDFRFFINWFATALSKIQYDTENLPDIYDPLRCPTDLLWLLADTMGFKYDDRLPAAFNRLVLVYFMSMIRHKGSKDGVMLAAETNLAQFNILNYGKENDILYERLEDTSIPINSVYVSPNVDKGYISVVYFSDKVPTDACIEYVRPLGMYLFPYAGVRFDARTKISVDARLTNTNDLSVSIGPTHVGHYSRDDYARMQKMRSEYDPVEIDEEDTRRPVWYRNKAYEGNPDPEINPGYRALYSLQLCNNEHIVKSLLEPIFGLGYTPTDVSTYEGPDVLAEEADYPKTWNLRYDKLRDEEVGKDVYTIDDDRSAGPTKSKPVVNPIMGAVGDAISMNSSNTQYTEVDEEGNIHVVDK